VRTVSRDAKNTNWRECLHAAARDHWRRAKLDDLHRASTLGAVPEIGRVLGGGDVLFSLRLLFRAEKVKAKR
jgi:hypothetical protein